MIIVQSTFQLVADTRAEALDLMRNMVRLCQQEHGCLSYEYFEGISDPNQVVLFQEWENAECLQEHYQTDHMEDFLGKLGDYIERPVITRSFVSTDDTAIAPQAADDSPSASPEQTIH